MPHLFLSILIFSVPCWITNISFQCIRAVKDRIPHHHWLRKSKIDSFDFIFFDSKPFIGSGLRITSLVPILILPFFFNLFLPISLIYYFSITSLVFLGDLIGSIIKRRLGYKKGEFAPFIDHGDYILLTGSVFVYEGYISLEIFILSLLLTYLLHPIVCMIGYKLQFKKDFL
jgi:CDP-diglyceride synthetase